MLPDFSPALILKGRGVQLELLESAHFDGLSLAADYEEIWRYMPTQATGSFFSSWFTETLEKFGNGLQITYTVRTVENQKIVGATAYYDLFKENRRLALGYSWYTPEIWGTGINSECKLLMLTQAFETWSINRIEMGADPRNLRSIQAIKKLGATPEGLLREHMISSDGQFSDTQVFSILAVEWPVIKTRLIDKQDLR